MHTHTYTYIHAKAVYRFSVITIKIPTFFSDLQKDAKTYGNIRELDYLKQA